MTIKLNIQTFNKTYSINLKRFCTSLLSLTLIIISIIVIVNGISKSFTKTNVEMSKHEKFVDYVERTGTAPTRENYEYYLKNN